ncbi:hypothetical protein WDW37_12825 [Bdellovibrionota bacterium FG-1]
MVTSDELVELTAKAKRLVRAQQYLISQHVMNDHPERLITAVDILECLKIGSAVALELREIGGQYKYSGNDRYRWFGEDQKDRVLRLIVIIEDQTVVVSAAEATEKQAERYHAEDQVGLAAEKDK